MCSRPRCICERSPPPHERRDPTILIPPRWHRRGGSDGRAHWPVPPCGYMTRGDDTGDPTMTAAIAGPPSRAPWRGAVMALIIAGIVLVIGLILLGLTGDVLVDWLWFT